MGIAADDMDQLVSDLSTFTIIFFEQILDLKPMGRSHPNSKTVVPMAHKMVMNH